ncbi:autotransporter domain-containing protein [Leptotrichia sp. OH3620_COT-345]|uniref:autotransporter outer membrane beta-barrel domain-containing protein n=1 Tax=Leptotrichia sp. OH3620_COT-345 TaxID=2491048 RepID=UPI000F653F6D|nr:autotransporter outer membrane beta-barrel domain-containing protein [Leptotrichia sp. OH3620_COT-345]RRD40163.1 autotransporter domain-containing protein [Leptotrichia sp. OH3620_COT-345]
MKKKLIIFILLTILKHNQIYATLYPDQNNNADPRKNYRITGNIITPGDLNSDTVISIQPNKYAVLLGKEDTDNPVNINIEYSGNKNRKIININSGTLINEFSINRGIIKGINKSNFNFEGVSIQKGKFRNEGILEISGKKATGINVTNTAEIQNAGNISVKDKAKGVFLNFSDLKFENSGKVSVTGAGSVGITGNKNKKVDILSTRNGIIEVKDKATGVSLENKMFFRNEGEINVFSNEKLTSGSEAIGVNINSEDKNSFENYGTVNVSGTGKNPYSGYNSKGIFINNEKGSAANFGKINVGSTGIGVISKGNFENNGIINVDGKSVGINILKRTTVPTEKTVNNQVINIKGESYGVQAAGNANFENTATGNIFVEEGATGIVASKETKKSDNGIIINKGNIFVSGERSTGIQANDNREIISLGTVEVEGKKYTSGIKASGRNSLVINEGRIIHRGDERNTSNAAVSQMMGTVENKGEIEILSGKLSSGMAVSENSFGINSGTGKIHVNEGVGIKTDKNGISVNKGEIILKGEKATGVQLGNAAFINDGGKIIGDKSGNAIFSRSLTDNTVILKNAVSINGKIIGNSGADSLFFENAVAEGLTVEEYNSLNLSGNSFVRNSEISLESSKNAQNYTEKMKTDLIKGGYINGQSGTLTLENSVLTLNKKEGVPIYINGNAVIFKGRMNLSFKGEGKEFSVSEYLGGIKVDGSEAEFQDSLVWTYRKKENNDVILGKNKYSDVSGNINLSEFAQYLENERNKSRISGDLDKIIGEMEQLKDRKVFNDVLSQISGVVHGYVADSALINFGLFEKISLKKTFSRDIMRNRPLNSTTHDIFHINDTGNFSGVINAGKKEKGIVGIWEKHIVRNNRLGFIFGATERTLDFKKNNGGKAETDTVYFGGYYDYALNSGLSFLTTVGTAYSHNSVKREININDKNYTFNSSYPVIVLGAGSKIIYTPVEKNMFRVSIYAGINFKKIFQGNINEERERVSAKASNLTIKNVPVNEKSYNSVKPNIGINVEKNGIFLNRVYRLGFGTGFETEKGNINKFKHYKLQGLSSEHKVKSVNLKNIFYYNVNLAFGLTENLSLTLNYRHSKGKEYKSDRVEAGFEYKGDVFRNNILNSIAAKLNNSKKVSRWRKTVGFTLDSEDPSDRSYYYGNVLSAGDYSKSSDYKPLIWLTLTDTKSKISYYFEGFYKDNGMFQGKNDREDKVSSNRLFGEIRYRNTFSKGNYGLNFGYKSENSRRPKNYKKKDYYVSKTGFHEFKLDANFSYNLGNGYFLNGKTTGMADIYYKGERKGQKDYKLENQYGFVYNGFSPKWKLQLMYFREDRFFDKRNNVERYISEQLRPAVTYNFGNGDNVVLDMRLPLGKGAVYKTTGTKEKKSETYEYRYGIKYTKNIIPGLNVFVSMSVSDIKVKNTDEKSGKFGEKTGNHIFRQSIGLNYSF